MEYTKKEFAVIRKDIDDLFDDPKLKGYNVRKSTYNWSSKNNWHIEVSTTLSWEITYRAEPEKLLEMVTYMFSKVNEFVHDDKYNFHFKNVFSKGNFGYTFVFQPITEMAKDLLNG